MRWASPLLLIGETMVYGARDYVPLNWTLSSFDKLFTLPGGLPFLTSHCFRIADPKSFWFVMENRSAFIRCRPDGYAQWICAHS